MHTTRSSLFRNYKLVKLTCILGNQDSSNHLVSYLDPLIWSSEFYFCKEQLLNE